MSGFIRNDWKSYLNGSSAHYNFSYRDEMPVPPATMPAPPQPIPSSVSAPIQPNIPSPTLNKNNSISNKPEKKNKNKITIPTIKGGARRKSLRRQTRRHINRRK